MPAQDKEELAVSPISEADALYRPFPPFDSWAQSVVVRSDLLDRYTEAMKKERAESTEETLKQVFSIATRTAAVDTGAIEGLYQVDRGFTYTVAAQEAAWQAVLEEKGETARHLVEAQLGAYELVLDAATRNTPVSEAWIRRLHEELCAPQEAYRVRTPQGWTEIPLPKGEYKKYPNHVQLPDGSIHAYAPVLDTPEEMRRFVEELGGAGFLDAHPVLQASYAHYGLVAIHPFADGNGRVARVLASMSTYRVYSVPLVIYADQRPEYYDALHSTDLGNFQPFVDFTLDRLLDMMAEITLLLRAAKAPPIEKSLSLIERLALGHSGLPHTELDNIASRLLEMVHSEFQSQLQQLSLPKTIKYIVQLRPERQANLSGYRPTVSAQARRLRVYLLNNPPAEAQVDMSFEVLIAATPDLPSPFVIQLYNAPDLFEVRLREIYPEATLALKRRLQMWVEGILSQAIAGLSQMADKALRRSGYV